MVTRWGFSKRLPPMQFDQDQDQSQYLGGGHVATLPVSDKTTLIIDEEVTSIINYCYDRAKTMLTENRDILEAMKDALLKYETIDAAQIDDLMNRRPCRAPSEGNSSSGSNGQSQSQGSNGSDSSNSNSSSEQAKPQQSQNSSANEQETKASADKAAQATQAAPETAAPAADGADAKAVEAEQAKAQEPEQAQAPASEQAKDAPAQDNASEQNKGWPFNTPSGNKVDDKNEKK